MTYQDVEQARRTFLKKFYVPLAISVAIIIIVAAIMLACNAFSFGILFILFLIAPALCFGTSFRAATAYRKAYKAYFVEQNLHRVFSDISYAHERGMPARTLSDTGLIDAGDRYSSNDYTTGRYRDTAFAQADVHIELRDSDDDGYYTIFKGRFMIFDFPKKFTFKLALVGKRFRAFNKPGANKTTGRQMEKISTESGEFNKIFKIYAEDGFEAFYILDPAFIAKIEDVAVHYKYRIIFCFVDNRLVIGIDDRKDCFEPPQPHRPIDEAKENTKVLSEIKTITDFVGQLFLDRKVFK